MIRYRITLSNKPTVRVWRLESRKKKLIAEVSGMKAVLVKDVLFKDLPCKTVMKFRDGRSVLETDEDSALRLILGLRSVIGLRDQRRMNQLAEAVASMDRGEIFWWYSLFLRLGERAIRSLREAYS